jgi:hypothetical protein
MAEAASSRWLADLNSQSPLELVLRGHLWIESRMIDVLCAAVPYPDRIDLSRFTFPQKVSLVAAHGVLDTEDVPAYLKINTLRNKVAHRLDAALTAEDEAALVNCLSDTLRRASMIDEPRAAQGPWPYALRRIMAAMIIWLEQMHAVALQEREQHEKAKALALRTVQEILAERERQDPLF